MMAEKNDQEERKKDPYTGEKKPPAEDADDIMEVVPVETEDEEEEEYLLEEETPIDYIAAEEDADIVPEKSTRAMENERIQDEFEERQQLAYSGRDELQEELEQRNAPSPELTGGDLDAEWEAANQAGDETVGGTAPTPDQDRVDELGEAVGVTYEDEEPLQTRDRLRERDEERWELQPESRRQEAQEGEPEEETE
jgi:hypothetical protein